MDIDERANVLLVDDNPANLLAVESVLAELGQNLVKARSGREALHHLLESDFAVIVLDVNMPDMSGFEAASLIRDRPRSRHTPIVFMTAISQSDDAAMHAYGLGAVDYIFTPVAPEVIRAKIKVFVDLFQMNQTLKRQSAQLGAANEELEHQLGEIQRLNRQLHATVEALDQDVAERKRVEAELRESRSRLQILHQIDRAILAAHSPAEIAQIAAHHVRQSIDCERAAVLLFEPEEQRSTVLAVDSANPTKLQNGAEVSLRGCRGLIECQRGAPVVVEELAASPEPCEYEEMSIGEGLHASTWVPLMAGSHLIGALELARGEPGSFSAGSIELASQVADSLAVAIQNLRLHEQVRISRGRLQQLSRRLVRVQEDERRAIARELHDEAGQALTALMVGLGMVERDEGCPEVIAERLRSLKQMTDGVMEELHRLAVDLRPVSLDRLGLLSAISQFVRTVGDNGNLQVELTSTGLGDERLPIEAETTLYRVVQEALTNVTRHAQATRAQVSLNAQERSIVAMVVDDGIGFDIEEAERSGRLGLVGMRERAEMIGGAFSIRSAPGRGTSVMLEVPLGNGETNWEAVPAQPLYSEPPLA